MGAKHGVAKYGFDKHVYVETPVPASLIST
jgi:hypothetical protein